MTTATEERMLEGISKISESVMEAEIESFLRHYAHGDPYKNARMAARLVMIIRRQQVEECQRLHKFMQALVAAMPSKGPLI